MSADVSNRGRHPWPFISPLERGTVDLDKPARCVGCGCTDGQACPEGCSWLGVNRVTGTGVCSNCRDHLNDWKAQQP